MKTELMSNPGRKRRHRVLGIAALAALAGIGIAALTFNATEPANADPAIPPGYALRSWQDNGANGKYLLQISDGQLPSAGAAVPGVVLSDGNCMPDAQGLSHCVNEIRFADGSSLTVIDNHNMSINRCLQPGEIISVSALDASWIVALTQDARTAN